MKKVLLTIAFLAGLFFIATSFLPKSYPQGDITYTENASFSLTGNVVDGSCVGEDITLVGDMHYVLNIVFKPSGGYHETTHFNASGLKGIGASGKLYTFNEYQVESFVSKFDDCRLYFHRVFIMKIISRSSNSNYYMKVRTEGYFNTCEQITTIESKEVSEECR
jgi:hypothetical protein